MHATDAEFCDISSYQFTVTYYMDWFLVNNTEHTIGVMEGMWSTHSDREYGEEGAVTNLYHDWRWQKVYDLLIRWKMCSDDCQDINHNLYMETFPREWH